MYPVLICFEPVPSGPAACPNQHARLHGWVQACLCVACMRRGRGGDGEGSLAGPAARAALWAGPEHVHGDASSMP